MHNTRLSMLFVFFFVSVYAVLPFVATEHTFSSRASLVYIEPVATTTVLHDFSKSCCRYLCYLFFQLKTHADELAEGGGEESPALSLFGALALLTAITLVVATNSE